MEKNVLITLKLIGFNEADRHKLEAILVLSSRALKQKWRLVEQGENADFFLIREQNTPNLTELTQHIPPERCLYCCSDKNLQSEYTLLVDNKCLPSLSGLVALFNRVGQQLPASRQQNDHPIELAQKEELFFDAQQGLLKYLLASTDKQIEIGLTALDNYPALYVDLENNFYYSKNPLTELEPYVLSTHPLLITAHSASEFQQRVATQELKPQPLKDLIWYTTLKISHGKVIQGYQSDDIVTLKAWPDLRLTKYLDYAKLAAFMKHNAAPLTMIAEQTNMPLAEVYNFYNACYLIGLVEQCNQIQINKKNTNPQRLALLAKIEARLK